MRLDKYNESLISRSKMKNLILEGKVYVNNKVITKPSFEINENDLIEIKQDEYNFPSRAGYKLLKAINEFKLDFNNKIVLDVGASTGGFTACSLYFGAKKVYAVDVGDSQLVDSLKNNEKVKSIENKNIIDLTNDEINNDICDFVVIDVSFTSLKNILPFIKRFISNQSLVVALIKPQFETLKYQNKSHIIKDPTIHTIIVSDVISSLSKIGYNLISLTYSPIKGSKGNIEFLGLFTLKELTNKSYININEIVKKAHKDLKKE